MSRSMQELKWSRVASAVALVLGLFAGVPSDARAEGTETLGEAAVVLGAGTGIVQAGVGLAGGQPADLSFDVPEDASIVQVLLYWSHETKLVGDPEIDVNGSAVAGVPIGGPVFFFDFRGAPVSVYGYRADITSRALVHPGSNTLTISGLDTQVSTPGTGAHGAGVLVIVDDGGTLAEIQIVDGVDVAYCGFDDDRHGTVPQRLAFTPSPDAHGGTLYTFAGSINESADPRSTEIRLDWDSGESESLFRVLDGAGEGDLFDASAVDLAIPAGAGELTFSIQSANEAGTCPSSDPRNASISWIAAALVVPLPEDEPVCGDGIVDPGEECDDGDMCRYNGCRNDCTIPRCGDGIRDRHEQCDDGNRSNGDGCSEQCRIERRQRGCPWRLDRIHRHMHHGHGHGHPRLHRLLPPWARGHHRPGPWARPAFHPFW